MPEYVEIPNRSAYDMTTEELRSELIRIRGNYAGLVEEHKKLVKENKELEGQALSIKTITENNMKRQFVQDVLEYRGGCESGKKDFLESIDLEDYIPQMSAVMTVKFTWSYGENLDRYNVEAGIQSAIENEYGENVEIEIDAWNDE